MRIILALIIKKLEVLPANPAALVLFPLDHVSSVDYGGVGLQDPGMFPVGETKPLPFEQGVVVEHDIHPLFPVLRLDPQASQPEPVYFPRPKFLKEIEF